MRGEIRITGWRVGFRKIEFTKLLRAELDLTLVGAKAMTDALLAKQELIFTVPATRVSPVAESCSALGAIVS